LTVVPLFCARWIQALPAGEAEAEGDVVHEKGAPARDSGWSVRFNFWFNRHFGAMLGRYEQAVGWALRRPRLTVGAISGLFVLSLGMYPILGIAFFPRTDAGQFVMNLKAMPGTRIELMTQEVQRVEARVRQTVAPGDLKMVVSNIGVIPGFSSIYTSNSGPYTATVQVALTSNHRVDSYTYMDRMRQQLHAQMPELSAFFQSGGMVDAILNQGLPAPIDVQVSGAGLDADEAVAVRLARRFRALPGVSDVFVPQDMDYPAIQLNVDRERASELGLSQKEVIDNVITALTSNGMIAPSYWIDPATGNDYMLTVQYPEQQVDSLQALRGIPLRRPGAAGTARLGEVASIMRTESPTEVDHYQIERRLDIYVNPATEDLGRVASAIRRVLAGQALPAGVRVNLRGMVQSMDASFHSFALGLALALVLLYLILVAQFRSFMDPLLILLAVPTGVTGVLMILAFTGTTLNVMSLMGVIMMVGIVVSNSILIVEFAHRLEARGRGVAEAAIESCRIRLRPILMTSLATVIGLIPLALKLGTGSEAYAPLARAIIGGLLVSVVLTVFIVPAAYVVVYGRRKNPTALAGQSS
ncbi:MAG: efflux RND transporter permease subunit, partial [Terriglobales bacterium]